MTPLFFAKNNVLPYLLCQRPPSLTDHKKTKQKKNEAVYKWFQIPQQRQVIDYNLFNHSAFILCRKVDVVQGAIIEIPKLHRNVVRG